MTLEQYKYREIIAKVQKRYEILVFENAGRIAGKSVALHHIRRSLSADKISKEDVAAIIKSIEL